MTHTHVNRDVVVSSRRRIRQMALSKENIVGGEMQSLTKERVMTQLIATLSEP